METTSTISQHKHAPRFMRGSPSGSGPRSGRLSRLRNIDKLISIIQSPAEGRGAVSTDQRGRGGLLGGRRRAAEGQAEAASGLAGRVRAGLGPEALGEGLGLPDDEA